MEPPVPTSFGGSAFFKTRATLRVTEPRSPKFCQRRYSGTESEGGTAVDNESLLTEEQQFRIDVIEALAAIDTEIDALQQAIEQGKVITPEKWKEIRSTSRQRLSKFREYHSQKIGRL